jgi:hypothetical protein
VETAPDTPTLPPIRQDAGTSSTQVTVEMPLIVDGSTAAGAATIASYRLEWNSGSGTTFTDVVGGSSANLVRTATVSSGIASGQSYTFRYSVSNIYGWSAASGP